MKKAITAEAKEQVEKWLDKWDDLLTSKGFTYVGEDNPGGNWYTGVWYVSAEDPETQPIRIICLSKDDMLEKAVNGKLSSSFTMYRIFIPYEEGNIAEFSRKCINASETGKKALDTLGNPALMHAYSAIKDADAETAWPKVVKWAAEANKRYNNK